MRYQSILQRQRQRTFSGRRRGLRLEPLEQRQLLAVDATFQEGVLTVRSDADDPIAISSLEGLVQVNGQQLGGTPIHSAEVLRLIVMGGVESNVIDLQGVDVHAFSSLQNTEIWSAAPLDRVALENTIDEFATALIGEEWQESLSLTAGDAVDLWESGAWVDYAHNYWTENATVRIAVDDFGARTIAQLALDLLVDAQLAPANTHLDEDYFPVTITGGAGDLESSGSEDGLSLFGEQTSAILSGGEGDDTLYGSALDDEIHGGEGDDVIYGCGGNDRLDGGYQDDTIYGGDGNDAMWGGEGNLFADGGTDEMHGGDGNDVMHGNDKDDLMYGGTGNDFVGGGEGNDVQYGGDGDDLMGGAVIHGGEDADNLYGGNGEDSYDVIEDSSAHPRGGDTIHFGSGDITPIIETEYDVITGGDVNDNGDEGMPCNCESDFPIIQIANAWIREEDPINGDPTNPERYLVFEVTLVGEHDSEASVSYSTADAIGVIAATANYDYVPDSGTLSWGAGDNTPRSIPIRLLHDELVEWNEIFYVQLSSPVNAVLSDNQATGLIEDDDIWASKEDQPITCPVDCECGSLDKDEAEMEGTPVVKTDASVAKDTDNPHPIFAANLEMPSAPAGKELLGAIVTVTLADLDPVSIYYLDEEGNESDFLRFVAQVDATSLPTGTYDYTMTVGFAFDDPEDPTVETTILTQASRSGKQTVINRADSEFGRKFGIQELAQLYIQADGVTFLQGINSAYYAEDGAAFVSPAGWFNELEKLVDDSYELTTPEGTVMAFSAIGLLTTVTDRNGNQISYAYVDADEDSVADELSTITDPFGRVTTFDYEDDTEAVNFGKLEAVTDYAGRVTLYTIGAGGLLTAITTPDPDGGGSMEALTTTFEYETAAPYHLHKITEPSGVTTTYSYDFAGRLTRVTHGDDSYREILPTQTRGLVDLSEEGYDELHPTSFVSVGAEGAVGTVIDELEQATTFTLDRFGFATSSTDSLGHTTSSTRDANGRVTQVVLPDPDGPGSRAATVIDYTYDTQGRLLTEQYEGFDAKVWTYDSATGQVTSLTDELGRTVLFDVDAAGNILHEQHVVGTPDDLEDLEDDVVWSFTYTSLTDDVPAGMLLTVTDPEDRTTVYRYYGMDSGDTDATLVGLVKSITFAEGTADEAAVSFVYYTGTRNLKETHDELDRVTTYEWDNLDRMTKRTEPDPDDNALTDNTPVWIYAYCNCGNLKKVTDPEGNITEYIYDEDRNWLEQVKLSKPLDTDTTHPTWSYEYYDNGLLRYETDPNGNVTEYLYDEANRLIRVIEPDPDGEGDLESPEWAYTYDAVGLVTAVIDPEGRETNFDYDAALRRTEVKLPEPTESAGRPTYTYVYNDAGQLLESHAPLGRTTVYAYDEDLGWLTSVTLPDPDGTSPTTDQPVWQYAYDKLGNVTSVTDPRGKITDYEYDARYRLVTVTQPAPAGSGDRPVWSYSYDAAGQMLAATDPMLRTTTYDYDFLGRATKVTQPDPDGPWDPEEETGELEAAFTVYTYDKVGNVKTVTDALNHQTSYAYDDLYRLITQIDANGDPTSFSYDFNGNILSLTDAEDNTTSWLYDGLNRVTSETNQLDDSRYFAYDLVGNLTSKVDRNERVTVYSYDNLDRMRLEEWFADDEDITADWTIEYAYDLAGRLTGAGDDAAEYTYSYDDLDRVLTSTAIIAGLTPTVALASQYDVASNRTKLAATIGAAADFVNDYAYDDLNRLKTVTQQAQGSGTGYNAVAEKRAEFTYNLAGQFDTIVRKAGVSSGSTTVITTLFGYDQAGRLTDLVHGSGFNPAMVHSYTYDQANRITSYHYTRFVGGLTVANRTATFDYDDRGQLTGDDRAGTSNDREYAYDDNGNRTDVSGTTWTATTNNQLANDGTFTYGYDDEGNRITQTRISSASSNSFLLEFEYDHHNRLTKTTYKNNSGTVTETIDYIYDAFERLVRRVHDANGATSGGVSETFFIWDGQDSILEFDGDGTTDISRRSLYGPAVDMILAEEEVSTVSSAGTVLYPLTDNQGSVRDIVEYVSGTGTVVRNSIDYDAFGRRISQTGGSYQVRPGYAGYFRDETTGWYLTQTRWYDPATGKWTTEDWIGFAGGSANLAEYAGNSATNYTDPSGMEPPWHPRDLEPLPSKPYMPLGPRDMVEQHELDMEMYNRSVDHPWEFCFFEWNQAFHRFIGTEARSARDAEPADLRSTRDGMDLCADIAFGAATTAAAGKAPQSKPAPGGTQAFQAEAQQIAGQAAASRGLTPNAAQSAIKPTMVDVSKLRNPVTRPWADPSKVQRLGPFDWNKYQPIWVENDCGVLTIQNGVTRAELARQAGIEKLPVLIFPK